MDEIIEFPITQRKLSKREIAAAKELYFFQKGRELHLVVKQMRERRGFTKFELSELVGNSGRRMRGLAPALGWKQELEEAEKAMRDAETIPDKPDAGTDPVAKAIPPGPFEDWLAARFPDWVWKWQYQRFIYKKLDRVAKGQCKRLMIFLPPRHGKSELVTVRFGAWMLAMRPEMRIIIGSYNQKLANKFSRKIRRIHLDQKTQEKEPPGGLLQTTDDWETAAGGGVKAVGVGAGVTGFGADLIIIDDPIRGRADANNENSRERVAEWYNDDLQTRLEPGGAIILIQTRWHEDDLAGRLLKEAEEGGEKWEVVRLPALAEEVIPDSKFQIPDSKIQEDIPDSRFQISDLEIQEEIPDSKFQIPDSKIQEEIPDSRFQISDLEIQENISNARFEISDSGIQEVVPNPDQNLESGIWNLELADPLGREVGEALCPDRFSREELLRKKAKMGSSSFEALYQQNPVPAGGGIFKVDWFDKRVDRMPPGLKCFRGYDLAVSTKTSADYTASFLCALDAEGNLYIADGFRKRIEYPEQRRFIVERMQAEPGAEHGIEEALHGKAIVQDLRRERFLARSVFRGVKVTTDKVTRASAWGARAEEGKVILVRGPWIAEFLEEISRFPNGRHDDQIDAVSIAVQMIDRPKYRHAGF